MHIEALNNNTKIVWEKCAFLEGFYLAGGTALALQIGHRTSVDLDFFSSNPIKKTLLSEVEKVFGTVTPIIKTKDELTIILIYMKFFPENYLILKGLLQMQKISIKGYLRTDFF